MFKIKGYGLAAILRHQIRGGVVCLSLTKTTGLSPGKRSSSAELSDSESPMLLPDVESTSISSSGDVFT
ncbi:unnamed protein product [Clavelina lepadiformis]|uniref:Uncharacterized protein n=1 Tax=Clavelina lepadiformis TaxID=159417 RepID=A0ABP0G5K1_CLALP